MSGKLSGFDATKVEKVESNFEPLPKGDYKVAITDSELRDNKAKTGNYIWLQMEVIDGPKQGRILWDQLTYQHDNPKAMEIGKSQFASVCLAVDVPRPNDTAELHNRPLIATVGIRKRKDNGELTNEVKSYASAKGGVVNPPADDSEAPW